MQWDGGRGRQGLLAAWISHEQSSHFGARLDDAQDMRKAGAAGCVQDLPAGGGPERGQYRWPVVMCVVRAVRRMLLKAQAHLIVGVPKVLIHADTMTHAGNAGWPGQH